MLDDESCTEEYRTIREGEKDHRFKYLHLVYTEDKASAANALSRLKRDNPTDAIRTENLHQQVKRRSAGFEAGRRFFHFFKPLR